MTHRSPWGKIDDAFDRLDEAFGRKWRDRSAKREPVTVGITEVQLTFDRSMDAHTEVLSVNGEPTKVRCVLRTTDPDSVIKELRDVASKLEAALRKETK